MSEPRPFYLPPMPTEDEIQNVVSHLFDVTLEPMTKANRHLLLRAAVKRSEAELRIEVERNSAALFEKKPRKPRAKKGTAP